MSGRVFRWFERGNRSPRWNEAHRVGAIHWEACRPRKRERLCSPTEVGEGNRALD